jgi:phosphoglycolate phosphatase
VSLLIFDLDGTLIDSRLDLAHAVNATRAEMGRGALPHELIFSYVGNGVPVLIQRAMGPEATQDEVRAALEYFLDYYRHHAVDCTELYPGVRESLERLHEASVPMGVLTNKPARISQSIMEHFGLGSMMLAIYGGNSFEHKKPHRVGIDKLCSDAGVPHRDTWMVGDSYVDVQTARNAGVAACGVTYGFQPDSFREFPPDVLVDRLEDFIIRFLPK